jgi:hypothetical protein
LLLINFYSCDYFESRKIHNENEINLLFKNKDLNRFFLGSKFYGFKGITYRDSTQKYKFTKVNNFTKLEMKNKYISGFQNGLILENSLRLYLHDLNEINTVPLLINFNKHRQKQVNFLPIFSRENLELLKNRSSKIFIINEKFKFEEIYVADDYVDDVTPDIDDMIFHTSTKKNLETLKNLKFYPRDFNSFIFIHNPLTGYYTCLPVLERFSSEKTNYLYEIEERMKFEKNMKFSVNDSIFITGNNNYYDNYLFENKTVVFKKSSKITLHNNAKLLFNYSKVVFEGSDDDKIYISGESNNSIFFQDSEVEMNFTSVSGLSNFDDGDILMPAAITFYNSNIEINNSYFENNLIGDDFINFYNSTFTIKNSKIYNSFADAIDSDFSNGVIENLHLKNIGNDGLDFSGSNVKISNSYFENVMDKAVSAGESSDLTLNSSVIKNSEMAIVVKDGSLLNSSNNILLKNKIDYSVFFKKDFYPSPTLIVDSINNLSENLFQKGIFLITDQKIDINYLDDVESLLYGRLYGKSSK